MIDVIGLLTEANIPRRYWTDMKRRFEDDEAFSELCGQCYQANMIAKDGKLRETDCADFTTMTALIQYLPMQYRREPMIGSAGSDLCGVYTILNKITQGACIASR